MPGPLLLTFELMLGNEIYIAKADMVPALRNRLLRIAAFQNSEFCSGLFLCYNLFQFCKGCFVILALLDPTVIAVLVFPTYQSIRAPLFFGVAINVTITLADGLL